MAAEHQQPPEEQDGEKGKSWRQVVASEVRDVWSQLTEGSQKCRPHKDQAKQNKDKSSVGKEIGIIYGSYLILNTIIGPGIFTSPKGVLAGAGSIGMSLVIWGICGVFSTLAALCFAELRESVKRDGVEYAYITEAFGPLAGFVYCWMRIAAAEPVGTAVFAVALADYTADTIYGDCAPPGMLRKSIAILAVVSLALLNVFSQKLADRMQLLATLGKAVACVVVVYFGLKNIVQGRTDELTEGFADTVTSPTSITFAFYNGLWAYGGWSNVNHVTSGLKKPPRNVPRLVKTVIPLVMCIYMLVVTSYFTVMSREDMLASEAIGVTWAERTFDGGLVAIIPIGVGLTALGSLNATFLSAGRLSGVAVKDGNMPEVTSWVHVRSKTPILTVYTRLLIAIIMILVAEIGELVRFFIFSVWLFHGMAILALLVLRFKNKDKVRPYKVNLVMPVVVVSVIGFLLIGPFLEQPKPEFISSLVLIALSLICYLPSRWIQDRASMPDGFIVWLQLFFRIAPKRDLRRKSILRRMSSLALARNSILIPAGASPSTIRRMSRVSNLLLHDLATSPALLRRVERQESLTQMDVKRGRSSSHVVWLDGPDGSPAFVRRRPSRQEASFGSADRQRAGLPKLESMPNLSRFSKDLYGGGDVNLQHNNNTHKVTFSLGANTSANSTPTASPLPNMSRMAARLRAGNGRSDNRKSSIDGAGKSLNSAPRSLTLAIPPAPPLPNNAQHHTISSPIPEESSPSPTTSNPSFLKTASNSNLPVAGRRYSAGSQASATVINNVSVAQGHSVNQDTSSLRHGTNGEAFSRRHSLSTDTSTEHQDPDNTSARRYSLGNDLSRRFCLNNLDLDLHVLGEYDSEGGGQYEILALPSLLQLAAAAARSRSLSSSSSSSSSDDWRLAALFDSSTDSDSSSSSSLQEDGSQSTGGDGYHSDNIDSDLNDVIYVIDHNRSTSYV